MNHLRAAESPNGRRATRFSFLLASGVAILAAAIVAACVSSRKCDEQPRTPGAVGRFVREAEVRLRAI